MTNRLSTLKTVFSQLVIHFHKHDVLTLAAALAFYTTLSLAPLLVITLSFASLLGKDAEAQLVNQIHNLLGDQAAVAIDAIIQSSHDEIEASTIAGILSILFLIFTAGGVFVQLQSSLNVILEATSPSTSRAWGWFQKRLLSMGIVLTLGFLALVSLLASSVIAFFFSREGQHWEILNFGVSIAVFAALFTVLFKYFPDVKIGWTSALWGGCATSILFSIGKTLIGLYLGRSAVGSSYGAAGSLVVLLTWVYYSAVILFVGAEITRLHLSPQPKI